MRACTFILLSSIAPPFLLANDAPDYLAVEKPIPDSLEASPSATDGIGEAPETRLDRGTLLPGWELLPGLRERIPRTGQPFFDEATFLVAPRLYYFHRDSSDGSKSEALALGGSVGVESGFLANFFRLGLTAYTSQKLHGPSDRDGTGLLQPGQQSYTVLGEAYAEFKLGKSFLTAGRQPIDLPYINAHDIRMTPNTFEGFGIYSTELEDFQFTVAHITKIKPRTSSDFESMSERAGAIGTNKGVTVAGARYNFSDRFHAGVLIEYGWDTFNTLYAETERSLHLCDDVSLKIGTQFTDQRSVGDELIGDFDAQLAGAKASLGIGSFVATTAVTWSVRGADIRNPWGGSPTYNSIMIADFDRAGEKSFRIGASYDFTDLGLTGFAVSSTWALGDTPDSGVDASPDQEEFNLTFDYRPSLEGLDHFWLRFRYALNERDSDLGGVDREDFRIILNYSFTF